MKIYKIDDNVNLAQFSYILHSQHSFMGIDILKINTLGVDILGEDIHSS